MFIEFEGRLFNLAHIIRTEPVQADFNDACFYFGVVTPEGTYNFVDDTRSGASVRYEALKEGIKRAEERA